MKNSRRIIIPRAISRYYAESDIISWPWEWNLQLTITILSRIWRYRERFESFSYKFILGIRVLNRKLILTHDLYTFLLQNWTSKTKFLEYKFVTLTYVYTEWKNVHKFSFTDEQTCVTRQKIKLGTITYNRYNNIIWEHSRYFWFVYQVFTK